MPSAIRPATSAAPIAHELTRTSPTVSRRASLRAITRSRCLFSLSELLTLISRPKIALPQSYARICRTASAGRPNAGSVATLAWAQRIPGITGNPLVAFRQRYQFIAADHVIDRLERPVAGTLKHLAQNRIRGI